MLFSSYTFIIFFGLVLLIFYRLRSWTVRKWFLLLVSYVFYGAWNPVFVLLLLFSTVADWFLAKGIASRKNATGRKLMVTLSLLVNLGLLGLFKYGQFMVQNLEALLRLAGVNVTFAAPDIVLPVGISFYTFQTLSYTLDVYFGKTRPWHSFLDYALYVTFFPQLVAGPIVRATDYLPQCLEPRPLSYARMGWGGGLLVLGLFEKVALADGMFAPIVERVYDATTAPDFLSAWCGTLAFAGQIFCDFGGYSTCAIGAALCLGFDLPDNFHSPYAATGFSDFWRRWHISLSTWLRDYLYIPLGGNRKGSVRTYQNLMMTMLLGGLWHGASWTFVVWGGLHGALLVLERALKSIRPLASLTERIPGIVSATVTFLLVCLVWVFFRAHTLAQAADVLQAMVGRDEQRVAMLRNFDMAKALVVIAALLAAQWIMRNRSLEQVVGRTPWWLRSVAIALMLVAVITVSGEDRAFIYFQF